MEKKTTTISFKLSPEMLAGVQRALARTTHEPSTSRFVRAVFADLIRKHEAGERIADPVELLTVRQRQDLEE